MEIEKYDLIIRNGQVVLPNGIKKVNIGIKGGVIKAIEESPIAHAKKEWDANGHYIFPGGIDPHVHFNDPGREEWEGFKTGSSMLAAGGGTTFFDMPLNGIPSTIHTNALFEKANRGEGSSLLDFGLWGGLVPGNVKELFSLAKAGIVGFKAFLSPSGNSEFEAVDDDSLLIGMKEIAQTNKILALHAESGPMTVFLQREKEKRGMVGADEYAASRPITAEVEAVSRALFYAEVTRCPLHFVHISSQRAVQLIQEAKDKGMNVSVETCPHYLLFSHDDLKERGPIAKCAPPLRAVEEREKLISALLEGHIDFVASDHSPCPFELKENMNENLFLSWGGISGGQFTLLSMIELALAYEIPFQKVANWTSTASAKRFGFYPQKGEIGVGCDADLAIISLNDSFEVTKEEIFAKHKESLYEGHTFPCSIMATFSKGELVFEKGKKPSEYTLGKWIKPVENEERVS